MTEDSGRQRDGTFAPGNKIATGANGHTPITDSINVILTRPLTDALDDEPMNNAQKIALEWAKKARAGQLDAIVSITDRVEGKPKQRNELTGANGQPLLDAAASIDAIIDDLAARRTSGASNAAKVDPASTGKSDNTDG